MRDGVWRELPRRLVVPGDIVRLSAGDLVPADARLLEAIDVHVQQAALTGESLPVEKVADDRPGASGSLADAPTCVFLGTSVVSGTATALVTATGGHTAFGDIVVRLAHRPPETEFERDIHGFGFLILQTVFFLILFVFLVGVVFYHPLFLILNAAVFLSSSRRTSSPSSLPKALPRVCWAIVPLLIRLKRTRLQSCKHYGVMESRSRF
jgi:Mg2+-importing ATPase